MSSEPVGHARAVGEVVVLFNGYQVGGVALHTSACPNELCLVPLSASASPDRDGVDAVVHAHATLSLFYRMSLENCCENF